MAAGIAYGEYRLAAQTGHLAVTPLPPRFANHGFEKRIAKKSGLPLTATGKYDRRRLDCANCHVIKKSQSWQDSLYSKPHPRLAQPVLVDDITPNPPQQKKETPLPPRSTN